MLRLAQFHWYCGRMGDIEGLSVYDDHEWEFLQSHIGGSVYFGEVLGKHSEIHGTLDQSDLKVLSEDQEFLKKLVEVFPSRHLSGFRLLDYLEDEMVAWESDNEENEDDDE